MSFGVSRRHCRLSAVAAGLLVSTLALTTATPAAAVTIIDSIQFWDGGSSLSALGEPNTATYGQPVTVPTTDIFLNSFSFLIDDRLDPGPVDFEFFVMGWDGSKATGPVLFQSAPISTTNNGGSDGFELITIPTGGVSLVAGSQVVLFVSASNLFDDVKGTGDVASASRVIPGNFVFSNNGSDFDALTTTDWFSLSGLDLAFIAEFDDTPSPLQLPEPSAVLLFGLGLVGLGFALRRGRAASIPNDGQRGGGSSRFAIPRRRSRSSEVTAGLFVSTVTLASIVSAGAANAVIFNDRIPFEATLGVSITDDYSSPGYAAGDVIDIGTLDIHSDANMSAVFGETRYTTTGSPNNNIIGGQRQGDPYYCAGCNGSYLLDFTATSIGTANGVFGVGLDVLIEEELVGGTTAFVTYGDGATENFVIPGLPDVTTDQFWGITDTRLISSIAFGLPNGGGSGSTRMAHDNLTIGTRVQALPEPSAILLFGLGLVGLGLALQRTANCRATEKVRRAASRCPGRRGFPR